MTTTIPDEAEVKRAMLLSGRRRILTITSSKIGTASFCRYAEINEFDVIITDSGITESQASELSVAGPEVIVV